MESTYNIYSLLDDLTDEHLIDNMAFDYMCHRLFYNVWQGDYRVWQMWIRR